MRTSNSGSPHRLCRRARSEPEKRHEIEAPVLFPERNVTRAPTAVLPARAEGSIPILGSNKLSDADLRIMNLEPTGTSFAGGRPETGVQKNFWSA